MCIIKVVPETSVENFSHFQSESGREERKRGERKERKEKILLNNS